MKHVNNKFKHRTVFSQARMTRFGRDSDSVVSEKKTTFYRLQS